MNITDRRVARGWKWLQHVTGLVPERRIRERRRYVR